MPEAFIVDAVRTPVTRRGGFEGQLSVLRSVAAAALQRELGPEEDAALRVALDQGDGHRTAHRRS